MNKIEMRLAREAGWGFADISWENHMVLANEAWKQGQIRKAKTRFLMAQILSRFWFSPKDPRRATPLINQAIILQRSGAASRAHRKIEIAQTIWSDVEMEIDKIDIAPRARSSLFHMRMEAKHRATYHNNFKIRLKKFSQETAQSMQDIRDGHRLSHRHFSRWNGERPNIFDDTRKIFAATLLIIDATDPEQNSSRH